MPTLEIPFAPWRFMLAVDAVNYALDEQVGYRARRPGDAIINLSSGVNLTEPPWELVDFALGAARDPLFWHDYDGPDGHLVGRAAVAAYEATRAEVAVGVENVLVTAGASAALALLARGLHPGGGIGAHAVLPAPTFPLAGAALADAGFRITEVTSEEPDRWLPTVDELTAAATADTRVVYVNTFNNPTGERYDEAELRKLVGWAREHRVTVLHDTVSSDVAAVGGLPHLLSIAAEEDYARGVVTVGSLSKSRAVPGFRIGWMIADADLIARLAGFNELIAPSSPGLAAPALLMDRMLAVAADSARSAPDDPWDRLEELLRPYHAGLPGLRGFLDRAGARLGTPRTANGLAGWRDSLRKTLAGNVASLAGWGETIVGAPPWCGDFNTFVRLPALDGRDVLATTHRLFREYGVQTLPGPAFGHSTSWWRRRGYFLRLSFALPPARWQEGLARLSAACERLSADG
ncbi:aminotransferase class I/II-fold pyridoxal phosphate-dependent enzyme [Plantactinospora sp. CA-294935]|uniref:aminotransferase class I/II-fold pyridoxal phosphate-dependent enzyme n=1 Tax=Plantactinospora sp. CA-294935 TaxID=3240012 RepID=UPI003D920FD2